VWLVAICFASGWNVPDANRVVCPAAETAQTQTIEQKASRRASDLPRRHNSRASLEYARRASVRPNSFVSM
jgi:hypothetical protein